MHNVPTDPYPSSTGKNMNTSYPLRTASRTTMGAVEVQTAARSSWHWRSALLVLALLGTLVLLNGCSTFYSRYDDPLHYNSNTGYPAVGGPRFGGV